MGFFELAHRHAVNKVVYHRQLEFAICRRFLLLVNLTVAVYGQNAWIKVDLQNTLAV